MQALYLNVFSFRELHVGQSYYQVTKVMTRAFGPEMAIFLIDLFVTDSIQHKKSRKGLNYDGWFYSLRKYRSYNLGMNDKKLQRLSNTAIQGGLIETEFRPTATGNLQWFKVNYDIISNITEVFQDHANADLECDEYISEGVGTKCPQGWGQNVLIYKRNKYKRNKRI